MPKLSEGRVPGYCRHKGSGQAYVTLDGHDIYLGPWGTAASRQKYNQKISEWMANGRHLPAQGGLTVNELLARFLTHAKGYYRKPDGTPTSEYKNMRDAAKPLARLYGKSEAAEFGPLKLKAAREEMIRLGWCRTTINRNVNRLRTIFKWAVESELVPADVHHALAAVQGLKAGRSEARESEPVRPVPDAVIDAIKPFVSRQIWAMVELQRLTGMRPGEACAMRGEDIDRTGTFWTYRPATHKTAHRGHERVIPLGPKAREVVEQFLKPDPQVYLFSPADAERERREKRHKRRVDLKSTPLSCGNVPGSNVKRKPKKRPGERYAVEAYAHAIYRGADRADAWAHGGKAIGDEVRLVERFHPHQLRHSAATALRAKFGLEGVQAMLGQRTLTAAQVYAEKSQELAERIVAAVG